MRPGSAASIRPAVASDREALARIFVRAWQGRYRGVVPDAVLAGIDEATASELVGELGAGSRWTTDVTCVDGDVRGFVRYGADPDDASPDLGYVAALYVDPAASGAGVGRRLLLHAVARLADSGRGRVSLWVFEGNDRARGLYESAGFRLDGNRCVDPRWQTPQVRMLREMSSSTVMAAEIAEQPEAVARTTAALLRQRADLQSLGRGRRHVLLVARGSSDNAAAYGRYLLETQSGIQASMAAPSIATHYRADLDLRDTLAVSISQSGETEEILQTQAWAADHGAATVAITNHDDSKLAKAADVALTTQAGLERAVPATKTYTTQLAALAVLASSLPEAAPEFASQLLEVPAEMERYLGMGSAADDAASVLSAASAVVVVSRGLSHTVALEVALKLEETCLRPVRGLSYADLRHGPLAVLDETVAVVLVAPPDGPLLPGLVEMADTVRRIGAPLVALGGDERFRADAAASMPPPGLPEALAPIAQVVGGQLIVERTARRLGLDPDSPRSLTKVTQTD